MDDAPIDLARAVADLADRVARLEGDARGPEDRRAALDELVRGAPDPGTAGSTILYAGSGPWDDGTVAWRMERTWPQALETPSADAAAVLGALASPVRVDIVRELLVAPRTTAELTERLGVTSSGQLFHHVKELLAAGLVHQPLRGTYAVRRHHVLPLLAVLSCAQDLTGPGEQEPSE